MNQKYSYKECYQILRIKSDCNWTELRKSYKLQIQKWHPDRYKENSPQKNAANNKIKHLNIAFQQLSNYRQEHGSLPVIEQVNFTASPSIVSHSKPTTPKTNNTQYRSTATNHREKKKKTTTTLILTIAAILYILFRTPQDIDNNDSEQAHIKNTIINSKLQTKSTIQEKKNIKTPANQFESINHSLTPVINNSATSEPDATDQSETFFTFGSTIGEVISIQGVPDKIENNVWFYGKSKVFFIDGKVSKWERIPSHPLKAHIILN